MKIDVNNMTEEQCKAKNQASKELHKAWEKVCWASAQGEKTYNTCKAEFLPMEAEYIAKYGYSDVRPMERAGK